MQSISANLKFYNPLQAVLLSALSYLILFVMAPIDFVFPGNFEVLVISVVFLLALCGGMIFGARRWQSLNRTIQFDTFRLSRFLKIMTVLSLAGLSLRIFERTFLRAGGAITSDFTLNRELFAQGGNGGVAFASSILAPLSMFLPFFVLLLRKNGERKRVHYFMLFISICYPLFDLLLMGSRSTLVIYVGLLIASLATLGMLKVSIRGLFLSTLGLIGLVWLAGYIFWIRTSQMGLDPISSMHLSAYARFAPASNGVITELYTSGVAGVGGFLFAFTHFCQYLLHGLYEFFYIAANVTEIQTFGVQTFYIPAKIAMSIFGAGSTEDLISSGVLRPGVYTTLFGPILYDFGLYGGVIACIVIGYLSGSVVRSVRNGNVSLLPLYLLITGFLPLAFVVNLFTSGTGQFLLIDILIIMLILNLKRYSLKTNLVKLT
ncbi:hypothetical protein J2W17_004838 [Pseudomonas lini]|uniref:hypothetical protein n=1 Tax=Pseudomonas lini TaxID=163011 RepID=UPI00278226F3|nr:hypothetical protein [Pseudomonas lini]MDQ0125868.1 hypothetical protein [Pseudomonas lini]